MLESFTIFTRGGLVLWKSQASIIEGEPLAHLIQDALIQPLAGTQQYAYKNYIMKWQFANDLNLVFVACYLKITRNFPVDSLLTAVRNAFTTTYKTELQHTQYRDSYPFEPIYQSLLDKTETKRVLNKTSQPTMTTSKDIKQSTSPSPSDNDDEESPQSTDDSDDQNNELLLSPEELELQRLDRIQQLKNRRLQSSKQPKHQNSKDGRQKKKPTRWQDGPVKSSEAATLNFSEDPTTHEKSRDLSLDNNYGISDRDLQATIDTHGSAPEVGENYWVDNPTDDTALDEADADSGAWSFFKGLVGQKELTHDDLESVAKQFTEKLVGKNVAPDVAKTLVDTVVNALIGKKLGTFNTLYATVKRELAQALNKLLTPKNPIDIMTGIAKAKAENRPYSIVFCGVNGVGKSTSLAKIAAFFLAQNLKVGVAACDTFRSGAIEQLKTHCAALQIPLYDRGYGKDEAAVAADGILCAKRDNCDIILIDTAGRMQGNDPLMKGLARLMNTNNPDLILFVGEALVGNDGCSQLINFNRSLAENSDQRHPRLIDGIVLTKFDTIDDKVGAAISMTHSTGQPILFVGTGQTYRDLKTPSPSMLINALLS